MNETRKNGKKNKENLCDSHNSIRIRWVHKLVVFFSRSKSSIYVYKQITQKHIYKMYFTVSYLL